MTTQVKHFIVSQIKCRFLYYIGWKIKHSSLFCCRIGDEKTNNPKTFISTQHEGLLFQLLMGWPKVLKNNNIQLNLITL